MRTYLLACFIFLATSASPSILAKSPWQTLQPGIQYINSEHNSLVAFKIDPQKYHFQIATGNPTNYVASFAEKHRALLAINGGYFSADNKSLGLRISDYQQISPVKNISWWGIFYLKKNHPVITTARNFHKQKTISFAIQAGPRLIVNSRLMPLKQGVAARSAIGISEDHKIIIASSKNAAITLTEWAQELKSELNCKTALNLDGGSSSQLYADFPDLKLNIKNFRPVSDAIVVTIPNPL